MDAITQFVAKLSVYRSSTSDPQVEDQQVIADVVDYSVDNGMIELFFIHGGKEYFLKFNEDDLAFSTQEAKANA